MSQKITRMTGVFALLFLMGTLNFVLAQSQLGTISGTVTDASGAVVAGATVEATNTATGEKRSTTTTEDGTYTIPSLTVANYNLTVNASGFAASTVQNVRVSVSFNTTQDFALNPQGASETVVVSTGDAQTQINTTDQQLSTLLDNKKIIDLPLLNRDPNALVLLAPGTVQTQSGLGGFSVNGQRERNNNFLVDGTDNNDTDVPGIPGGLATPNIDATQEFRVITGNFNAEFGRNTGAIITTATKNGTNDFHGGAYMYYRSDAFSARNFFDITGSPDPLQRRQFGASIGGPIKRDTAFFFFNYEGDRFTRGLQQTRTVPTANARIGIFTFNNNGVPTTIDARTNGINNAFGLPVNPASTALLNAIFPLPNRPGVGTLPGVFEEFRFSDTFQDTQNQYNARVDWKLAEKHTLTGSLNANSGNFIFGANTFPGSNDQLVTPQRGYHSTLSLTSNINANMINVVQLGYNRAEATFGGPGDLGIGTGIGDAVFNFLNASGGSPTGQFGGTNGRLLNLAITGPSGATGFFDTQFRFSGTTSLGDQLTYVSGNHTYKGGFETRFIYSNGANNFGRSETVNFNVPTDFGFPILQNNAGTAFLSTAGNLGTIQNFSSFLYGLVSQQLQSQFFDKNGQRVDQDYRGFRTREIDFFFQDTWRVRPNLTLNYGLRYEFNGVPYEVNGQLSTLVDQDPSGFTPPGGFRFQLVGKNSGNEGQGLYQSDFNNFAPRFGFNYSPGWENGFISKITGGPGKMTIRGGYGVFYDRVFGNLFSNARGNPPFQQDFANFPILAANTLDEIFVGNVPRPQSLTPSPVVPADAGIFPVIFALPGNNQFQSKFATPYTQAWNFGFQRELGNAFLFEADYVGNKGTNLLRVIDGQLTSVPRVNAITGSNNTISPTGTFTNYLNGTLNQDFFQVALNLAVGHSTYHALQTRVTKTLSNKSFGLGQIQGAYTWSHSIDNSTDPLVAQTGERTFPRDSSGFAGGFNRPERGDSGFDTRHRFVLNFIYELPFEFGNKALDLVLGDWSMSGIAQVQSGNTYSVFGGTDSAGTGLGQRADYADPNAPVGTYTRLGATAGLDPRTQTGPTRDLFRNPCSGTVNAAGTTCTNQLVGRQGTVPRSAFVGPAFSKVDFSLIKRIPLGIGEDGRYRFTIRADFFNIFNRVNFAQPVFTINSSNFGQSTAAFDPRIVQFVGRFDF